MTHFADRLSEAVRRCASAVLVGIDPRVESLPAGLLAESDWADRAKAAAAYVRFSRGVIDVVAPLVPAVKPQTAFFEQLGPAGMSALWEVIRYARQKGLLVILDGKRNDIGSTAEAYASGYLDGSPQDCVEESGSRDEPSGAAWGADAMTVNPYLGDDSLEPFVRIAGQRGAGVFVLVKTSNPGGPRIQDLVSEGKPVFRHVAQWVEELARSSLGDQKYGHVGAVVGATYSAELSELRQVMPHVLFLIPGYGAQGATARDLAGGFDEEGFGALVNSSRGILFAYERSEYDGYGQDRWEQAIQQATQDTISDIASETPAGVLQAE